jgi:hypothetical protein
LSTRRFYRVRVYFGVGAHISARAAPTRTPRRRGPTSERGQPAARKLHDALIERGVLVRLFDVGLLAGCMRITVGTPEENGWLLDALKSALA